jgi:8-oxo-dGTP diphosphatase
MSHEATIIVVVGAAIVEGSRVLVAKRGPGMSAPDRWEFPGGKVEGVERHAEALRRELAEELGVDVTVGEHLGTGRARSPRGDEIVLEVYRATLRSGRPVPHEHAELRWVGADDLAGLRWAEADVPVVPQVAAMLSNLAGRDDQGSSG